MESCRSGGLIGRSSSYNQREREYPLFSPVSDWIPKRNSPPVISNLQIHEQDFEFSLFGSSGMISADEIFRNGRLIPCSGVITEEPNPAFSPASFATKPGAGVERQNSLPARMNLNSSSASSSLTTTTTTRSRTSSSAVSASCSSRLRRFLSLRPSRSLSSRDFDSEFSSSTSSSSRRYLLVPESGDMEVEEANTKVKLSGERNSNKQRTSMEPHRRSVELKNRSRVYPKSEFWIQSNARRVKDSSYASPQVIHPPCQRYGAVYDADIKVTPVLNMPVCMGDSSKLGVFDHHLTGSLRRRKVT